MSYKHNNKYFNNRTETKPVEVEETETVDVAELTNIEDTADDVTEEIVEEPSAEKTLIGTVTGCRKLNIRKNSDINSEKVTVVNVGTKLTINPNESTAEWYKIAGISSAGFFMGLDGYCMKKYVTVEE